MEARTADTESVDLARTVAFTDGVFAIAITLLVLNLQVPRLPSGKDLAPELDELIPDLLAYFLSFAVVGRFWIVHHRVFRTLRSVDGRLLALNLLYLAFVALVPFTTALLGSYGDQRETPIIYAVVLACASLTNWVMIRHSLRREHVRPEARQVTGRFGERGYLSIPAIFAASIPVALVSPLAAEVMWLAAIVLRPGLLRRRR